MSACLGEPPQLLHALVYGAQIAADHDIDAIKAWLARFVESLATFDSYRKEAERLLLVLRVKRIASY
jgi:hypothetical protein